ncbi:hypothetical protein N9C35_03080 [Flavobacteriaceae bacterium]|nr:hypothetical protein [Flavobacteriaceae bacterium]
MLRFCILFIIFILPYSKAFADIKEIEVPLLSYHIKEDRGYKDAPMKLDSNGTYVFNPGILLSIDYRKDVNTEGFSGLLKGGFLQDCGNETALVAGGGFRYRKKPFEKISFDFNGYAFLANAVTQFGEAECPAGMTCPEDPDVGKRETVLIPMANIGMNYHLESGKTAGVTLTYIPANTAIAATSGTPLLFLTANLMF